MAATICRLGSCARVEAAPVIFNNRMHLMCSAAQDKSHACCTRMFCDVVKRFLNDPIKNRLNLRRDASGLVLSRFEIHLNPVVCGPGFRQRANRFDKSEVIESSRTQFHCHAMKVARGSSSQFLEALHSIAETGARLAVKQSFEAHI